MTIEPETITHHGTERDYLRWRLNMNYQRKDPGTPDYAGVRRTGVWEVGV